MSISVTEAQVLHDAGSIRRTEIFSAGNHRNADIALDESMPLFTFFTFTGCSCWIPPPTLLFHRSEKHIFSPISNEFTQNRK